MSMEELAIGHKALLGSRLRKVHTFLSEYSFANLYLFRKTHDYKVLAEGEGLFIVGRTYDGARFVMPTAAPENSDRKQLIRISREYDFIFPVPEEWLDVWGIPPENRNSLEGDSDYVYLAEKISTYHGQKLHSKKNLLNQFLASYTPEARPLTADRKH